MPEGNLEGVQTPDSEQLSHDRNDVVKLERRLAISRHDGAIVEGQLQRANDPEAILLYSRLKDELGDEVHRLEMLLEKRKSEQRRRNTSMVSEKPPTVVFLDGKQ